MTAAPEAPADDLSPAEVRRMMEIGLHAVFAGRAGEALKLFDALGRLRPGAGFPRIGIAQALLAAGRANEAVRVLEAAHAHDPADDDVRVMLGLALRLAQRMAQTARVLEPLLHADEDGPGRLARRLMALPAA